jgi:hypothetical protein
MREVRSVVLVKVETTEGSWSPPGPLDLIPVAYAERPRRRRMRSATRRGLMLVATILLSLGLLAALVSIAVEAAEGLTRSA